MTFALSHQDKLSIGLGQIFKDAVEESARDGYLYLAVLPSPSVQPLDPYYITLAGRKDPICLLDVFEDFIVFHSGAKITREGPQHFSRDKMASAFVGFKNIAERDLLLKLIEENKPSENGTFAVAYENDRHAANFGERTLAVSGFDHNLA